MIAFKQPLLASDTQLQPGTSSDSKSTMMDCLAKTADQRRSKFRCVSGCARLVQSTARGGWFFFFPSKRPGVTFRSYLAGRLSCRAIIWILSDNYRRLEKKTLICHGYESIDSKGSIKPGNRGQVQGRYLSPSQFGGRFSLRFDQ